MNETTLAHSGLIAPQLHPLQNSLDQGSPMWCRGHQVTHKNHVGHPQVCSKNNISMINVFTLTLWRLAAFGHF